MNSFLNRVAAAFVREVGDDITDYTFVFPNHRAGLFFRKYLGMHFGAPRFSPSILTINECFASLSSLKTADQLTLLVRLYRIYMSQREEVEPIEQFLHWGQMMLADFSEVDNHLVENVQALFTAVDDFKSIDVTFASLSEEQREAIRHFWSIYAESADHHKDNGLLHKQFLRTWNLLWPMYSALRAELRTDGLAYDGMLHRDVIEQLDSLPDEMFRKHYVFIGFNAMTKSEETLMLWLQSKGKADFYFDYDSAYLRDPENRASLFYEHNQKSFHSQFPIPIAAETQPELNLISVSNTVAETYEVHRILNTLYSDATKETDLTRTAVVLPDEQMLIPLQNAFPEQVTKINVTMGYPLRATSLYLPIAAPDQYWSKPIASAEEYICLMNQYLSDNVCDENSEAVYQIQQSLTHLQDVITRYPSVTFSYRAAAEIMRMMTLEATIPYVGEPLNGLQVMGVLETRALDFDNIIITSFNDDLYPGHTHQSSFIPYVLRRGFQLPTTERQDAIFAYNFYRMLSHAEHVWMITNSTADGIHSGEPSRFLYQLEMQYHLPVQHYTVCPVPTVQIKTCVDIDKTPEVMEQLSNSTADGISASGIKTYLQCEKQFYYSVVEHIHQPKPDDGTTISPLTMGNVFHDIIQQLYRPYKGQTVTAQTIDTMLERLNDDASWETFKQWKQLHSDPLAMLVMRGYVRSVLQIDRNHAPFVCHALELEVKGTLDCGAAGIIPLQGRIDRVDRLENGWRILDYKTGKEDTTFDSIEAVFDAVQTNKHNHKLSGVLQTLFYCLVLSQKEQYKANALQPYIYSLPLLTSEQDAPIRVHLGKEMTPPFAYDQVAEEYEQKIVEVISQIFDSSKPFACSGITKQNVCDYCPYYTLCRN